MKYLSNKQKETIVLTSKEFEKFSTFIDVMMYKNPILKIELQFNKINDENWIILNELESNPSNKEVVKMKISNFEGDRRIDIEYAEINFDEETGAPLTDDWVAMMNRIVGRAIVYAQAQDGAMKIVPSGANPIGSIDLLGKSYIVYHSTKTVVNDGKEIQIPAEPFVKLASGLNLSDKVIDTIKPIKQMSVWTCFGTRPKQNTSHPTERGVSMIPSDKFPNEFGVNISDTVKMWELIESRKIYPLYQIHPNIEMCISTSGKLTENILAENQINPKFSKSNIIL